MQEVFGLSTKVSPLPLPAVAVLIPLIGAALMLILNRRERWRDSVAIIISALTFLTVVLIYPLAIAKGLSINYPLPKYIFGIGLDFSVDPLAFVFALITSLVWFLATVYSVGYMEHEKKRTRYYFFLFISLAANLGVVVSGDLFSLFIFFEALGLFSYPLVVHAETDEALRAGTKYMLMNIIGGVTLLAGILLLYFYSGSVKMIPALETMASAGAEKYLVAALLIAGFGVKAGFVPLHIWLPDAHPVAPSPASALLSGIMIKAGAYGIIRTAAVIFRPPIVAAAETVSKTEESAAWLPTTTIGYYVVWIGITTMLIAAIMALLQENGKRLLAYSSVSQMGYIIMGIGAGTFLAAEGSLGLSGAVFHIVNHALFKSTFFLVIGAVYFVTHELNIYNLGGLWRKMPLAAAAALIAAGGITGVPLLNGYASKTLLFEGIKLAGENGAESSWPIPLQYAEWLYLFTSALTTAYILKFVITTFFGEMPRKYEKLHRTPVYIDVALGTLSSLILAVGLFPNFMLKTFFIPIASYWRLPLTELEEMRFFTLPGIEEALVVIAVGTLFFLIGTRYGYFRAKFPNWFSIDYFYQLAAGQVYSVATAFDWLNNAYETAFMKIVPGVMALRRPLARVNEFASRLLFAVFVDMWLFRPVTPSVREKEMEEKSFTEDVSRLGERTSKVVGRIDLSIIDRAISDASRLGEKTSEVVSKMDLNIIDRLITVVAVIGERLSVLASLFDIYIIDGIVNGVGWIAKKTGRGLRPIQTGDVQNYGLIMVAGAIIIIFVFALAFYGVFKLL